MKKELLSCRVFTTSVGWSDIMFIFDVSTKFSEIKNTPGTSILTRDDYIGTYDFDKKFISYFDKKPIGNKLYFFRNSYDKEEPNIFKTEEKIEPMKDDGSFDNFDSLF